MARTISIGRQDFAEIRENQYFFIDKTELIEQWWESGDAITLITRPRRFGKTLNLSMMNYFFSNQYKDRGDLFEGLKVWERESYRKIQGTYPVLFISFADVKQATYGDAVAKLKNIIVAQYSRYAFLGKSDQLTAAEQQQFQAVTYNMDDVTAQDAIKNLCTYLERYYGKKVLIFLDEYDTPMQEAYVHGYWDAFAAFMRSMFNATFKTNPSLERALMTGITRISRESMFSDLNNLNVITTTSKEYMTCFGFTEEEVFDALEEMNLTEERELVKKWYDGFTFGTQKDIYNPWSITNFLDKREYATYWVDTSSNRLVSDLIQRADSNIKEEFQVLMQEGTLDKILDEQIAFDQLGEDENAIWSLLLASGYLRVAGVELDSRTRQKICSLKITNFEVMLMFERMVKRWFGKVTSNYNDFVKALLLGDIEAMNYYMNRIALATFSSFDTGKRESEYTEPERFYHGFVLGLLVELREEYVIRSNGESGMGRYDIMLLPRRQDNKMPGIVMEFKVRNVKREATIEDTVRVALAQIEERQYDTILLEMGIAKDCIRHYGFAFEGKQVLIEGA